MRFLTAVWFLALISVAGPSVAAEPWDGEAFSGTSEEMLAAVQERKKPKDADIEVLLDETTYEVDEERRIHYQKRRVFRCLTRAGARDWAVVQGSWDAWHEERPQLDARVITRDGKEFRLDPKTVAEVTPDDGDSDLFHDHKQLRAPLPAMASGCIVEEVVRGQESRPFFAAGALERCYFFAFNPTACIRMKVIWPETVPVQFSVRGMELEPKETVAAGKHSRVYERRDIPEFESPGAHLSPDTPRVAYVSFSTGTSWEEIASAYHEVAEQAVDTKAVKSLAEAAIAGLTERQDKIQRLNEELQRLVRYTGVEFGESAIVPTAPKNTLARRFGDCKDQSVALVSMLKAVGIDANVALVNAGTGEDTRPELPALNAFNHAIVYVPGKEPIWIDPTAEFLPAGVLPNPDQGRRALVIVKSGGKLVTTPRLPSSQNGTTIIKRAVLHEWQPSTVTHVVETIGSMAGYQRGYYAERSESENEERWKSFGESIYDSDKIISFERTDPYDVAQPMRVTAKFDNADFGDIEPAHITVTLELDNLIEDLPYELTDEEEYDEEDEKDKKRTAPLHLSENHFNAIRYDVTPPAGYVAGELPENFEEKFGPITVSATFQQRDDGGVLAEVRLDTGSGIVKPKDAEKFREWADEQIGIYDEPLRPLRFEFTHPAQIKSEAGAHKEALAAFRKLIEAHPDEPLFKIRYAEALLTAGFGAAAHDIARQAVKERPDSAKGWTRAAEIFSHNEIGKRLQFGFPRAEAMEAYLKAIELDPDDVDIRWAYSRVAVHDDWGYVYSYRADFEEAIKQLKKVRETVPYFEPVNEVLMMSLLFSEDFEGLLEVCEDMPESELRNQLWIAAVAAIDGVPAALAQARRLHRDDEDDREGALLSATDSLNWSRQYKISSELLERIAKGHDAEKRLMQLVKERSERRRVDEMRLDQDDPARVVQDLLAVAILTPSPADDLRPFMTEAASKEELQENWQDFIFTRPVFLSNDLNELPPQFYADSLGQARFDNNEVLPGLWMVRCSNYPNTKFFVEKQDGEYRVLPPDSTMSRCGVEALAALKKDNLETARNWLALAFEREHANDIALFNWQSGSAFGRLWTWSKHDDKQQVQLAAAALASLGPWNQEVIDLLEKLRKEAGLESWQKLQIHRALFAAYLENRRGELILQEIEKLKEVSPLLALGYDDARLASFVLLQKKDEVLKYVETQIASDPGGNKTSLADLLGDIGCWERSTELHLQSLEKDPDNAVSLNELAWMVLFRENPDCEAAIKYGEKAKKNDPSATVLHTLAAVYAMAGRPDDALETLQSSIKLRSGEVRRDDWFVFGRVAEDYGLPKVARQCYERVDPPEDKLADDTWHLAQRRLQELDQSATSTAP